MVVGRDSNSTGCGSSEKEEGGCPMPVHQINSCTFYAAIANLSWAVMVVVVLPSVHYIT